MLDERSAKSAIKKGTATFLGKISNTRKVWLLHQNGKQHAVVYNRNSGTIERELSVDLDCVKKAIAKAEAERINRAPVKESYAYRRVPINHPVDLDRLIRKPQIIGWRPIPSPTTTKARFNYLSTGSIPKPSETQKRVRKLIERDGEFCVYCGVKMFLKTRIGEPKATLDHIIPKSKGGTDALENLVLACAPCNNKKGAIMPAEWFHMIWGENLENCPHGITPQTSHREER